MFILIVVCPKVFVFISSAEFDLLVYTSFDDILSISSDSPSLFDFPGYTELDLGSFSLLFLSMS